MILTRRKPSTKTLIDGTHLVSIASISEIGNNTCAWIFSSNKGQIRLELPINESLHKFMCQIGFLGGIPENNEINTPDLINLQIKIIVKKSKITSITKP